MEIAIIGILAILVIVAVALPLFRSAGRHADAREYSTGPQATSALAASPADPAVTPITLAPSAGGGDAALEAEIARYREAVAAGTVCERCGLANDRDAKFCAECGRPLGSAADADAQEFA